ncbi:MAG: hypothetical protein EXR39_06370 [Betaproteobacteria bacterium]|nr:hypothetical protein [Betaproteobacteria bacterium]
MNPRIEHLVAVAAPLWAGEAEVVRTYWTSPKHTAQTDMLWLARQCFKEFWGSGVSKYDRGGVFLGVMKKLIETAPAIDITLDRTEVLDTLEGLKAEFSHYCAFADVYDEIRPAGTPKLNPHVLEAWPEEDALTALRYQHQDEHGAVGMRACKFTEGGYCTLFSEGMALAGKGGIEEKIAAACAMVYEDEFGHMLAGMTGITDAGLKDADWKLIETLVVAQLQKRIHMRNGQFGYPLAEARIQAIFRGDILPVAFDYAKAKLAA